MKQPSVPAEAESLFPVDSGKSGIPAATLVIFGGPDDRGHPELLFVERSAAMRFAPGAVVFPGGRVDEDDHVLGIRFGQHLEPDDAAARVAAIRETVEETGLLIGLRDRPDRIAEDLRSDMLEGRSLADWLDSDRIGLDLDRLAPFARWDPRFRDHRAFDTRFYLAGLNGIGDDVVSDGTENSAAFWASAKKVLDSVRSGNRSAIFPTERNLERLASLADHNAAIADSRLYGTPTITPTVIEEGGEAWLCIPEGSGYPVTRVPISEVSRGKG
ncbi:NUDIX hydrolase [Sphingorhabdus soli]|uniref:NUDIX hydrolase n=1 Tax=Flavisphingopyxis soli TaxID=2601267 RepID=A0A5C6U7H7_9SPHN|nr:NUDIX domain-containing protein [Sphingorhabdus soli]TXC68799.1 NUDIX hydrolase [Sphingorhabdus soli]